jgi:hypothetical protein
MKGLIKTPFFVSFISTLLNLDACFTCFQSSSQTWHLVARPCRQNRAGAGHL